MLRTIIAAVLTCFASHGVLGQSTPGSSTFEIASVRSSKSVVGHDGTITIDPGRFVARNATLKRLIFEAWQIPYAQISGGPAWLNMDEYDIEAKAENAANREQLMRMLRVLLTERFKLAVRIEKKEGRVYALVAAKGGSRLRAGDEASHGAWRFHGDLSGFANVLAIQLTIPLLNDPGTPSYASGPAVPVLNKTGIEGVYDIGLDLKPDQGGDTFTVWQRALHEQLGLSLESQKASIEVLVIEHAEKVPTAN